MIQIRPKAAAAAIDPATRRGRGALGGGGLKAIDDDDARHGPWGMGWPMSGATQAVQLHAPAPARPLRRGGCQVAMGRPPCTACALFAAAPQTGSIKIVPPQHCLSCPKGQRPPPALTRWPARPS